MMIILQLITVVFAVACAYINQFAVILFRNWGSTPKAQFRFHAVNAAIKILWAFVIVITIGVSYWPKVASFFLLLLIQWLFFDIALNVFTDQPLFYLGKTAWLDRLVKNGLIKAIIVLLLIIALNFLL